MSKIEQQAPVVLCVALNPAIDQTIEVAGLRPGEVNRARHAQQDAGGKGFNVASCLADHGVPVAVTGLVGRENAGIFSALFETKRILNDCLLLDGLTRINTKLVDTERGATTDINLPGPRLAAEAINRYADEVAETIARHAGTLRWLVLSGSLPPGWADDAYAVLIRRAQAHGIAVLLDTSGPQLAAALPAGPTVLKPNREELSAMLQRPLVSTGDIREAALELLGQTPQLALVAVSMGHEGALFVTREASVMAHPLSVKPLSSVGAGDAMVAGIVAAYLEALSLSDCACLATAFAAGKLARLGAHLPMPGEVRALARKVRIEGPDQITTPTSKA